jgi:hypothetical protein
MANFRIKGIDEEIYTCIKKAAAAENRSVSQYILFLIKKTLAGSGWNYSEKTTAQTLLELSGSWDDERPAEAIISECSPRSRKSAHHAETTTGNIA